MYGHRSDRDGDWSQRMEAPGPVMSTSASSSRTAAYEESAGVLSFVSRYYRSSHQEKDEVRHEENSLGHEGGVFDFQSGGGNGTVAYAHSDGSSSNNSNERCKERSATKNSANSTQATERAANAHSSLSQHLEKTKEGTCARSTRAPAGNSAMRSGKVHVAPSASSSASDNSSATEYAPPSINDDSEEEGNPYFHSTRIPPVPLPLSGPPANALIAETHMRSAPATEDRMTDAANKAPLSSQQRDVKNRAGNEKEVEETERHLCQVASLSPTSSSASLATTSATSSDSDSDSDSDDVDEDADSVGGNFAKMPSQNEGLSSSMPFRSPAVRRHTLVSPTAVVNYTPTRDVRSSLVSTIDVDVAVEQERRRQRQRQLYLQASLHQHVSVMAAAASTRPLHPLTPAQRTFLQQRADAAYRRHMDAFVESYLCAPRYRTALAQFRKHLSVPEQRIRTTGARGQYLRATEITVSRGRGAATAGGSCSGAGAAGHESDWWRVGTAATEATDEKSNGSDRYRLEKTDLELLAGDSARRARLLDDTLPWRPIDFDAAGIRLEALEHLQADLSEADAVTGGGVAAPAVGGSVSLLIEVLVLTEVDVPFTSIIPLVNYTNIFLLLASLFVQPEVLLTKFIRLYRSVRAWEAKVADSRRAVYLERRILQCILVYCRVHETDLTLSCLQRLAVFAASEGFLGPVNALNDAIGKDHWPCQEGVYCASRKRAAMYACAVDAAAASGASPTHATTGPVSGGGGFGSLHHYKRHGFIDARRAGDLGIARLFPQRNSPFDPSALLNPATRIPLQSEVAQTLLEFVVYLQRITAVYYRPVDISLDCQASLPFAVEGPPRTFVDTLVLRPSLGDTSPSRRTAVAADPRLMPELLAPNTGDGGGSIGTRFGERFGGSSRQPSSPLRDHRYRGAGLPDRLHGSSANINLRAPARGLTEVQQCPVLDGREGAATGDYGWAHVAAGGAATPASPHASTLETTVMQRPLSVMEINSEHLSQQISLLSFSLFAAVHIRELLNNAWTDTSMKISVSTKLTELMEFSSHLQRWTAAVIVTPTTWAECQRALRYFLEVCRMLYEQQNYEMAAAILEGLRHPAVEYLERIFAEARGQGPLSLVERRELETLQELMDPFASYSPSSLYSVTARTVGDMETPMIPLLSPILGVILRSEDVKGSTVSIRNSDGKAIVNWSKVIGLGKVVVLWMRCQYTPFSFPVDPEIQEFLWSTMNHQWTDALLLRAARRAKQ
ncbi:hypothetical protein ABL78_1037 [Leptomonas seymouri]|uniref:Ras-GEF domain-containing protein n=1 Tax=Leptomonas seymouri TaxID=5684 RepID=A0A0N1IMA7_LEPSE|nr:hypothetical protein ABL78_1037 [Leptomonas seymouri]|eukprot:KPI89868.1 hypothetical protein ABL78_1037 [Leptomonas seymouri]